MASDGGTTANDALELEAMHKEDSSWHPCQVSLCPSGVGLIIDYGNDDFKDIIVNKEEAFDRLRIRSLVLQGDDCSKIQQGEHVLATQESSKSLFFDAEVEKTLRVRHSKKVHCRCTFTIKWLHQEFKGTLIVPSNSIMKLATENINVHPIISAFMNTLKSLSCPSISPLPTVVKDMDYELDLHELLGKQIEEISNSAGAAASKKKLAKNLILGFEVGTEGEVQCRAVDASKVSYIRHPPDQNHMKRSTRSRNEVQTEIELKDPPPPAPSIQEEFPESRSPLNPLAARAALASLMSKLPQNVEFSIYHEEGKSFNNSYDTTTHNQVIEASNGSKTYISSVVNDSSMRDKLSSKVGDSSIPFVQKADGNVTSLFSTNSSPRKPQLVDAFTEVLAKESENENKTPEVIVSHSSFICSTTERKISQPTKSTRLTRSAAQKSIGNSDDDIDKMNNVGEIKLRSTTKRTRLSRSTVHMEEEIQIETKKVMEESKSVKYTESDSSDQIVKDQGSYVLKDKNTVASQTDAEIDLLSTEERKSLVKKEVRRKKHDIERNTCAADKNSNNTRRVTRSAAVHLESGKKTAKVIPLQEENKFSEDVKSDLSQGHVTDLENNVLETKKSIHSPLYAEITLPPTEGRNKRRKKSDAFERTQKTEENGASNGENSRCQKKSTSSSKELRFSPRLRFLPRTRSQNKS